MQAIVHQPFDSRGGHVHPGIRRGIVDKHFPVIIGYPAIRKEYIRYITDAAFSYRSRPERLSAG